VPEGLVYQIILELYYMHVSVFEFAGAHSVGALESLKDKIVEKMSCVF
jgi:hypothetical protein